MPLKIIIADDDPAFRYILRKKINAYPQLCIVAETDDGEHLLEELSRQQPDIVITDYNMPKVNGVRAIESIKKSFPEIKAVILTSSTMSEHHKAISELNNCECFYKNALDILCTFLLNELKNTGSNSYHLGFSELEQQVLYWICQGKTNEEIGLVTQKNKRTIEGLRKKMADKIGVNNSSYNLTKFAQDNGYDLMKFNNIRLQASGT